MTTLTAARQPPGQHPHRACRLAPGRSRPVVLHHGGGLHRGAARLRRPAPASKRNRAKRSAPFRARGRQQPQGIKQTLNTSHRGRQLRGRARDQIIHSRARLTSDQQITPGVQIGGSARVLPDLPVTLSREIGLGSILRSIGPNVSEANEIPGSQVGSQRRQILGDAGPRLATVGAARRRVGPHPAASGDVGGMPPKQSLGVRIPPGRTAKAKCVPEATLGHTVGLCHDRGGEQCVREACLSGGVPGRLWAAAAGRSELPCAGRAGVPAGGGRPRPRARQSRERWCRRRPPARAARAGNDARGWLLATRSRSPLPTIPRCGWRRLPRRAAGAPVRAAPAAPATAAGCRVSRDDRYCCLA
jgi:hypothetical protein